MLTGNYNFDLQRAKSQTRGMNSKERRLANKLSTDKPYEDLYPNKVLPDLGASFIIYANGTRWVLKCWVYWELYWVPFTEDINNFSKQNPEYCCTWLPGKMHIRNIKTIIWKHPNCTKWQHRGLPTWVIILLWKMGY